jgi:hypothetical protein
MNVGDLIVSHRRTGQWFAQPPGFAHYGSYKLCATFHECDRTFSSGTYVLQGPVPSDGSDRLYQTGNLYVGPGGAAGNCWPLTTHGLYTLDVTDKIGRLHHYEGVFDGTAGITFLDTFGGGMITGGVGDCFFPGDVNPPNGASLGYYVTFGAGPGITVTISQTGFPDIDVVTSATGQYDVCVYDKYAAVYAEIKSPPPRFMPVPKTLIRPALRFPIFSFGALTPLSMWKYLEGGFACICLNSSRALYAPVSPTTKNLKLKSGLTGNTVTLVYGGDADPYWTGQEDSFGKIGCLYGAGFYEGPYTITYIYAVFQFCYNYVGYNYYQGCQLGIVIKANVSDGRKCEGGSYLCMDVLQKPPGYYAESTDPLQPKYVIMESTE